MYKPKIVVVGSINTDIVVNCKELPKPGETVLGGEQYTAHGGKGANQAVAASRAGADVALIAKVGKDDFGDNALKKLRKEKVNIGHVSVVPDVPSGVAVVAVDENGNNQIVVAGGANYLLSDTDIEEAAGLFKKADFCLIQLEIPIKTASTAIRIAKENNVPVLLNPAPMQQKLRLRKLIAGVDYVVLNRNEAEALTGINIFRESDAMLAAKSIETMGAKNVVISLGAEGALICSDGIQMVSGIPVKAVDTVGAGDVLCAVTAVGLSKKMAFSEAVGLGCAAASISVTKHGAQASFPTRLEINKFMKQRSGK